MRRRRGITFKLAILFLLVGVVPMATVGLFAYLTAKNSMTRNAVEFLVSRVARDTAYRIDVRLRGMARETELLATSEDFINLVADYLDQSADQAEVAGYLERDLNRVVGISSEIDLFLVLDMEGRVIASSRTARRARTGPYRIDAPDRSRFLWSATDGAAHPLADEPFTERAWWKTAQTAGVAFIDWHVDTAVQGTYRYPYYLDDNVEAAEKKRPKNPEAFSFGYTCGIPAPASETSNGDDAPRAILVTYYNWVAVQDILDSVNQEFRSEVGRYRTGYTFLFQQDRESIIGHLDRRNYRTSLVDDHGIVELYDEMGKASSGISEYDYPKHPPTPKISGFAEVPTSGWFLGFGINNEDVFAEVGRLRNWLLLAGIIVAGIIAILIAFVSRWATRPIHTLIDHTVEIAHGNLDARVEIRGQDEIAELMGSFNAMAEDLEALNKRIIQAEKTAAWQEMARQVAHEIKNPLTPMKLSAQLVQRAYDDEHPDFETILRDGMRNIISQVESLRRIASDFSAYASLHQRPRTPEPLRPIIEECVALYTGVDSKRVQVRVDLKLDEDILVECDRDEVKRVFINLFNNALEAMPDGGELTVAATVRSEPSSKSTSSSSSDAGSGSNSTASHQTVDIRIRDTGVGIDDEIRDRLFEPYFTTRTSGTGLGLAICKQTIESYDGTIAIDSRPGSGTTVTLTFPVA